MLELTRALKILETFKQHKAYIGVVVDEYGVTIGVITLHDLIENIFGDLPQLDDEPEDQDIITREDGSMLYRRRYANRRTARADKHKRF